MNNIDAHRARLQAVQLQARKTAVASDKFQLLMQAPLEEDCANRSATEANEKICEDKFARLPLFSESREENASALPKGVVNLFWESLQQDFKQYSDIAEFLNVFLRDITYSLQNSHRLQNDSYKLMIRLQPDFLPATALEINCNSNRISIVLRTAKEDTYRIISDALPRLNEALGKKNFCTDKVQLYLVALEDLP